MIHKKFFQEWIVLLLALAACTVQTKATPPFPTITSSQPSPRIETSATYAIPSSSDQTNPFSLETPYFDRQYKLDNTCDDTSCLFFDNVNQPSYPIGYAMISGHYLKVDRINNGETETCDGFVIDSAPKELLSAYESYFMGDAAVYSKTLDGKSEINIQLSNEDEATKQIIFSSSPEKPITLRILNEPPVYYGTVSCFSPLSILNAIKPLLASDLSQVYTITEADNGKVFTYVVTTRFSLVLDDVKYPSTKTICVPETIFGEIAGTNVFEITKTGKCQLQNGNFQVTIVGVP